MLERSAVFSKVQLGLLIYVNIITCLFGFILNVDIFSRQNMCVGLFRRNRPQDPTSLGTTDGELKQ